MRLFLGLPVYDLFPEAVDSFEARIKKRLKNVKWVNFKNLHITLHFFGETDPEKLKIIQNVAAETARHFEAFPLVLEHIGVFPSRGAPRVLWIGVSGQSAKFIRPLQQDLEIRLSAEGFKSEERKFNPHITFARPRKGEPFTLNQTDLDFKRTHKKYVRQINLYESRLSENGSVYHVRESFALKSLRHH